jgi:hypothetical protein
LLLKQPCQVELAHEKRGVVAAQRRIQAWQRPPVKLNGRLCFATACH